MRVRFTSLEELQELHEKTYADKESEKEIEKMLNKNIEVYYDENYFVWSEGGILLGYVKDF